MAGVAKPAPAGLGRWRAQGRGGSSRASEPGAAAQRPRKSPACSGTFQSKGASPRHARQACYPPKLPSAVLLQVSLGCLTQGLTVPAGSDQTRVTVRFLHASGETIHGQGKGLQSQPPGACMGGVAVAGGRPWQLFALGMGLARPPEA